jgi:anhydro-N-acetylmuramic acid kinase
MSGTSVDAIDSAVIKYSGNGIELVATHAHPIGTKLQRDIAALSHPGDNEIERMGTLDRELGHLFAQATLDLLAKHSIHSERVVAIGSHGQTVRHAPKSSGITPAKSFTVQIGDPNTIAELTGITTVADFRRRDIAAEGEGAPLAPAFHAAALSLSGINRAIVNIGGIANVTILDGPQLTEGFDTGPGNTLLDHWHARHQGGPFDNRGKWAASGNIDRELLKKLLNHPYFQQAGPKSTGKEAFNLNWLDSLLGQDRLFDAVNVQATLAELTAVSISHSIFESSTKVEEVYICGGGAHNDDLMSRLAALIEPARVANTSVLGISPDWVEAMTFAWLAQQTLSNRTNNAPQVTGAKGPRILGAIYPG